MSTTTLANVVQPLLEHLEVQVVPLRKTEPLVAVGEGFRFSGADVPTPLVPRAQRLAHVDHRQPHPACAARRREGLVRGEQ